MTSVDEIKRGGRVESFGELVQSDETTHAEELREEKKNQSLDEEIRIQEEGLGIKHEKS